MKILQVITLGTNIGGAQIHILDLAISLHKRGHDVHVLTGTFGELNQWLTEAGVPNTHFPSLTRQISPLRDIQCFLKLRTFIKQFKPDIVASHSSKAGIIVRLVCFFMQIPNTFTVHGWSFEGSSSRLSQGAFFIIEKIMGFFSHKLITVADTGYDLALKHRTVSPQKLVTIYNGVRDFGENTAKKSIYTEGGNSCVKMVMAARFQVQKDHETLVKALIPLKNASFHLEFLGDGTETLAHIQSLVHENGLTEKVRFVGFTSEVVNYLRHADICLLVSHSEGLPLSILEAMSIGLPIIASNVGGVSKQVKQGYNGFLVERKDIEDLTEKIKLLMNNPTLRREMGKNSRSLYENEFQLDKMVDKTLDVYQSILP
ncbi:MAG: glycosyltransferase family 4 protein [Saprospiraceae bacterium]|nr:glycosyltransferase family 4 protein [Saprospiraceae bacterium]